MGSVMPQNEHVHLLALIYTTYLHCLTFDPRRMSQTFNLSSVVFQPRFKQ